MVADTQLDPFFSIDNFVKHKFDNIEIKTDI